MVVVVSRSEAGGINKCDKKLLPSVSETHSMGCYPRQEWCYLLPASDGLDRQRTMTSMALLMCDDRMGQEV